MDHVTASAGRSRSGRPLDLARQARLRASERRIGAVTRALDDLIKVPGTGWRFGLDPLVGLIPVVGDLSSALVAGWIILEAARFRLPRVVLARMVLNALLDLGIGLIPVLGDVLDFGFKSNTRNLELFHRYASDPDASTASHGAFLAGLLALSVGVAWLLLALLGRLLATEI